MGRRGGCAGAVGRSGAPPGQTGQPGSGRWKEAAPKLGTSPPCWALVRSVQPAQSRQVEGAGAG